MRLNFGDRIVTLLLATQIVLLALALVFTPQAIELLAPAFPMTRNSSRLPST